MRICSIDFDDIIIILTDQNGRPVKVDKKVNLALLINKQKLHIIILNQEQENMLKNIDYCNIQERYPKECKQRILNTAIKNKEDIAKPFTKNSISDN